MIESVWEIEQDKLTDLQTVGELIETLWMDENSKGVAFDLARALYWHCVDYHEGQWSDRYAIMCGLEYKPGCGECSPGDSDSDSEEDEEDEAAGYVYSLLASAV